MVGKEKFICSRALGFNESSGPKDRTNQDLRTFCKEHHARTCCERHHTRQVMSAVSQFHEMSEKCIQMSRIALCSLCDGDVGIGLKSEWNHVVLCPSFCRQWFQACIHDFFSHSSGATGIQPCRSSSVVCSRLGEITEDSAAFCTRIGDFIVPETEEDSTNCHDGVPASFTHGPGPRAPWTPPAPPPPPPWLQRTWDKAQVQLRTLNLYFIYCFRQLQASLGGWLLVGILTIVVALIGVAFLFC